MHLFRSPFPLIQSCLNATLKIYTKSSGLLFSSPAHLGGTWLLSYHARQATATVSRFSRSLFLPRIQLQSQWIKHCQPGYLLLMVCTLWLRNFHSVNNAEPNNHFSLQEKKDKIFWAHHALGWATLRSCPLPALLVWLCPFSCIMWRGLFSSPPCSIPLGRGEDSNLQIPPLIQPSLSSRYLIIC